MIADNFKTSYYTYIKCDPRREMVNSCIMSDYNVSPQKVEAYKRRPNWSKIKLHKQQYNYFVLYCRISINVNNSVFSSGEVEFITPWCAVVCTCTNYFLIFVATLVV